MPILRGLVQGGVQPHESTHASGGSDAFLSTDIIEAIVKRLRETGGPTTMAIGAVADGEYLKRSGSSVIGGTPAGNGIPPLFFGDGSDGDLTASSGTTTLSKDTYYNDVTLSGTAKIVTAGYRLFVAGTLDLTNAGANAVSADGTPGNDGVTPTGGAAPAAQPSVFVGGGGQATAGTNGSSSPGTPSAPTNQNPANGGASGTSGDGGKSGARQGNSRAGATVSNAFSIRRVVYELWRIATILSGGAGGPGGGGGSTSGGGQAGGGGSGGNGGMVLAVFANVISRGASTAASAMSAAGGIGGNGGAASGGSTSGGGGGGSGGGGGWIYVIYGSVSGSSVSNMLDASGATGGSGGNGVGSFWGGTGGSGGSGGRITLINAGAASMSETFGSAGTAATGASSTAGTSGGAGNSVQVTL